MRHNDEDWHVLNLALDLVTMLERRVPDAARDHEFQRVYLAVCDLAERVSESTHLKTRAAYKVARRRALACARLFAECKLPIAVRRHGAASLIIQLSLLDDLCSDRRAPITFH
jgi:hypothetical protein